ncbi:hypothetical protein CP061683_1403B, partial [Chlamydia psittaci 06-1683]
EQH